MHRVLQVQVLVRFATIYTVLSLGQVTCVIMLSGPCFLITTSLYDYPGQIHAVTGTVAILLSVLTNSVKRVFFNSVCKLALCKSLVYIKISIMVNMRQMI